MKLKLTDLVLPKRYVRHRIKGGHVQELLAVVRGAAGPGGKPTSLSPLPPLLVRPLAVQKGKGQKYEVLDGMHRLRVAGRLKLSSVDADVKKYASDADAYMAQLTTNLSHGLALDRESRDEAVKTLGKVYHVGVREIARQTKLAPASVSRIIAGKQYLPAEKRRRGGKATRGKAAKAAKAAEWSPIVWLKQLEALAIEWGRHTPEITAAAEKMDRRLRLPDAMLTYLTSIIAQAA